jgi:hypothetical protein
VGAIIIIYGQKTTKEGDERGNLSALNPPKRELGAPTKEGKKSTLQPDADASLGGYK